MFHWTHTGPYAGTPFCDVDKEAAQLRGETFRHVSYNNAQYKLEYETVCEDCRKVWDDAK